MALSLFRRALPFAIVTLITTLSVTTWTPVVLAGGQLPTVGGTLTVTSEPPGADVFVDGALAGTTPLTISPISEGEHRVRVARDGFLDNARVVNVRRGRSESYQVRLTSRGPAATPAANQAQGLKIVVLEGEDVVNIVQQQTAVRTVVEVRDRNNSPVAGAAVLFRLGGSGATLNGTGTTVSALTNAAGQATVAVTPAAGAGATAASSSVQLSISATFQGQTAALTVGSTTAATASGAGAGAGSGSGGGAGAGASAGAAGGGAAGGLSTLALTGIIAGGAATAGVVAVKATGNDAPNVNPISASSTTGLVGVSSTISFSASASDKNSDPLTYTWDFGDGASATGESVAHGYAAAGTFTVRVTVNDGKDEATAQTTVTIKSLTGTWRSAPVDTIVGVVPLVFTLSVSGTSVSGTMTAGTITGTLSGTLRSGSPNLNFVCSPTNLGTPLLPFNYLGNLSPPFDAIVGSIDQSGFSNQPLNLTRQ